MWVKIKTTSLDYTKEKVKQRATFIRHKRSHKTFMAAALGVGGQFYLGRHIKEMWAKVSCLKQWVISIHLLYASYVSSIANAMRVLAFTCVHLRSLAFTCVHFFLNVGERKWTLMNKEINFLLILNSNEHQWTILSCWTINDIETARHFRDLGVDSITTDFPKRIRDGLKWRFFSISFYVTVIVINW